MVNYKMISVDKKRKEPLALLSNQTVRANVKIP